MKNIILIISLLTASLYATLTPKSIMASDGEYTDKILINDYTVSGATQYNIGRATSKDGPPTYIGETTLPAYAYTEAEQGVGYWFFVRAYNARAGGWSEWSTSNSGYEALPQATLTASDGTYLDNVVLTPSTVSGADSYYYFRSDSITGDKIPLFSVSNSMNYNGGVQGTLYYFWVKARNVQNGITAYGPYSPYNTGYERLNTPINITATDGLYSGVVRIQNYTNVINTTTYSIYRADDANGPYSSIGDVTGNTTYYNDSTAVPGTNYYYRVKARHTENGYTTSSYLSVDNTGWRNLLPPSNVSATDGTYLGYVRITYDAVDGATKYRITRADDNLGTNAYTITDTTIYTSYNHSGGEQGTMYYYTVEAFNDLCGWIGVNYDTGYERLNTPTSITATDGTYLDKVLVSNYDGVPNATNYVIYRANNIDDNGTYLGQSYTSSFETTNGTQGTRYWYRVRARRVANGLITYSDYSDSNGGHERLNTPTSGYAGNGLSSEHIRIWGFTGVDYATGYRIRRGTNADGTSTIVLADISSSSTEYLDTSAEAGTMYYYKVAAKRYANNESSYSYFTTLNSGYKLVLVPSTINATDGSSKTSVTISGYTTTGATKYQIYRANLSSDTPALLANNVTTSTYNTTYGDSGVRYFYYVKAFDPIKDAWTALSASDTGYEKFQEPLNILATDGTSPYNVTITNYYVAGASAYQVWRANSTTATGDNIYEGISSRINDTSSVPDQRYFYYVKAAKTANDFTTYSSASLRNIGWRHIAAPSSIDATDGTHTDKVLISNYVVTGGTDYQIWRGTQSDGSDKAYIGSTSDSTYDDTTGDAGVTYYYFVRAFAFNSDWTNYSSGDAGYKATDDGINPAIIMYLLN